ncbi:IS110 family transposase [Fodinibius salsisoli]|uniref:IS110 family transposase n=1 Tax=Fodinibius salsisoli TaxID=2820877 RepID=A0ABT3PQE2_9BACT|nr:IS110 family transposase [Fodinibius salsisoli]MCW9708051.1 IS110 family transposase [Fodinibius salsisoli]
MEASYYIGIDISKQRLDWQVNDSQNNSRKNGQAANTPKGIHKMIGRWKRGNIRLHELIVCFEHTGPYGLLLATILEESGICYVVVSAVQVQLSLGIRRGKSDPIDARRLAEYLWRFQDRLSPSRLPSKMLLELRGWLLWREKLVKMRTALINGIKANTLTSQVADLTEINEQMQLQHDGLTKQLKLVDRTIKSLLHKYNTTEGQYDLLASIPGIGPVIAGWLLVYTEGFTRFDNARQLACFAGSAPFPKQSGQKKSPDRVSRWRCQRLKSLLLNGVHSAIQYDPELRAYYERKCGEGKHPQSVRNAVICKLLYRVFAVINRGTPYVKIHQHEAIT